MLQDALQPLALPFKVLFEKADAITTSHPRKNKPVNASFKAVRRAALCQGKILLEAITLPSTSLHPTVTGEEYMSRERQLVVLKKCLPAMYVQCCVQAHEVPGADDCVCTCK